MTYTLDQIEVALRSIPSLRERVLYLLYRSDGGRTHGDLCSWLFNSPRGRLRKLRLGDTVRLVDELVAEGLVYRYGIEDGVWWMDLTIDFDGSHHPGEGHDRAKKVFDSCHAGVVSQTEEGGRHMVRRRL